MKSTLISVICVLSLISFCSNESTVIVFDNNTDKKMRLITLIPASTRDENKKIELENIISGRRTSEYDTDARGWSSAEIQNLNLILKITVDTGNEIQPTINITLQEGKQNLIIIEGKYPEITVRQLAEEL